MKSINFLPEVYRQRRILRHARLCWMAAAMLIGVAIAGAASGQWYLHCDLAAQLDVVEPQFRNAQQRQSEFTRLREDNQRAEELAALYVYLEHPWPRTQLLAAVANSLPPSIQLTDLHLLEQVEVGAETRVGDADTNHSVGEGGKSEKPNARSVLAKLRKECDRQKTILELSGDAGNTQELHEYVASLARSPLIGSASLKGLESGGEAKGQGVSRFHIRAAVRPGYGQPGAPPEKASGAVVAVAGASGSGATNAPGGEP